MEFVEKSVTKSDEVGNSFQGLLTNVAPAVSMYVHTYRFMFKFFLILQS